MTGEFRGVATLVLIAGLVFAIGRGLSLFPAGSTPPPDTPPIEQPPPPPPPPPLVNFTHDPAGTLVQGSGTGRVDNTLWAPDMRFPIESLEAFANSQVWGVGGSSGPAGSQCDARNYAYPWHDNFCEKRDRDSLLCPTGKGHQGQDIRPGTCEKSKHWAVAAETGQITAIGSYSVTLTAESARQYRYLHVDMSQLAVTQGQHVTRGDHIGFVSNDFGGTPTTIHLHFEIRMTVTGPDGQPTFTFVPPYASLVRSYDELIAEGQPTN